MVAFRVPPFDLCFGGAQPLLNCFRAVDTLAGMSVGLFTAGVTRRPGINPVDCVEASYAGYARSAISAGSLVQQGQLHVAENTVLQFGTSPPVAGPGGGGPVAITGFGYWVTLTVAPGPYLVAVQSFDQPLELATGAGSIQIALPSLSFTGKSYVGSVIYVPG